MSHMHNHGYICSRPQAGQDQEFRKNFSWSTSTLFVNYLFNLMVLRAQMGTSSTNYAAYYGLRECALSIAKANIYTDEPTGLLLRRVCRSNSEIRAWPTTPWRQRGSRRRSGSATPPSRRCCRSQACLSRPLKVWFFVDTKTQLDDRTTFCKIMNVNYKSIIS